MENCGKFAVGDGEGLETAPKSLLVSETARECGAMKVRACSACAGDYEDPDRTAGEDDEDAEEADDDGVEE